MFVHPYVGPPFWPAWEDLRPGWEDLRPDWEDLRPGWEDLRPSWEALTPGWESLRRVNGKYPHSTGLRPLLGPCYNKENQNPTNWKTIVKQGKVTADHLMPLGDWFFIWVGWL